MTKAEQAVKDLCCRLQHLGHHEIVRDVVAQDYRSRELVITRIYGNYGFAGVAVLLNGSPPRGWFVLSKEFLWDNRGPGSGYSGWTGWRALWFDGGRKCRMLGPVQSEIVKEFVREQIPELCSPRAPQP